MSSSASDYWHLVNENKRLTNSLKVIRDYVKSNSDLPGLHILEICVKTLNYDENIQGLNTTYKPLSK